MKIQIKGKLTVVENPIVKSGKDGANFSVQSILITRTINDEFGDPTGKVDRYPIQVMGDDIEKLKLDKMIDLKVNATCYLNCSEAGNGKLFLNLRLKSLELVP